MPPSLRLSVCLLSSVAAVAACSKEQPKAEPAPKPSASGATTAQPRGVALKPNLVLPPGLSAQVPPAAPPVPADVAAPPADAQKTKSGLAYKVLSPGKGTERPKEHDRVKVHYSGWTTDGKMFDSSVQRGQPATFAVSQVIKGWTEGLQLMVAGERRRLWIPAALAYGETPRMGAPSGNLTFDVELLEIIASPPPPETPKDVKGPPPTAKKTASGLAYRLLEAGKGTRKPTAASRVTVHYTGWTTDGKLFDSSVTRGEPTTFPLSNVIKGWTEGLQLMKEGDTMRFWIPAGLAYGDKPQGGRPAGMLVFDVKLVTVH